MRSQWLWIPERVPSRNELDDMRAKVRSVFSRKAGRRVRVDAYHDFKRRFEGRVELLVKQQGIGRAPEPAAFTYVFFEPNRKRDPSNFTSSGQKLIEDALQACGVIQGDGWKHVSGFRHYWDLTPTKRKVGVGVCIGELCVEDRLQACLGATDALGAWLAQGSK